MTSLYIGAPIEHGSDKAVLKEVLSLLARDQRDAVVLANVNLGGRQIDLIVGLAEMALVIEAKGFHRPVRGGVNGAWQYQAASGDWLDFPNPYLQALGAKLKVRDAMASVVGSGVPYPDAALIFEPCTPDGSEAFGGDFKVSVGGLADLDRLLGKTPQNALALDDWEALADQHGLDAVSGVEAACDPAMFEAENLLQQYVTAFRRDQAWSSAIIPFTCRVADGERSSRDVGRLISEERVDILIKGPSGCGKSLLAMNSALALAERGGIPVRIPGANYGGNLKAVLDGEVRELVDSSALNLLAAARALNRPLLFVVDGFNECPEANRASLTRRVSALARWWRGGILATSQTPLVREDRLNLCEVEVPPPERETKVAIALTWTGGVALPKQSEDLLDAVSTGLEARLIGEVGQEMEPGSSRHALFYRYARKRLGDLAAEGIPLLSHLAGWLSDRVAFSLSRRDFDRQADAQRAPGDSVCPAGGGFMVARGNRVSFAHEMFFDAFAAENVVRGADGLAGHVLKALESPVHAGRKALIIGAIDDNLLRREVLEGVADAESIVACVRGECGQEAREWAEARCSTLWKGLRAEAAGVRFRLSGDAWWKVAFEEKTLRPWTGLERALLAAMPKLVGEGRYLGEALEAIGVLDQRIAEEEIRLREGARELKVTLRDALFANAYVSPVGPQSELAGVSHISARLHGCFVDKPSDAVSRTIRKSQAVEIFSPGQVYMLLMLSRGAEVAAPFLVRAIESHWRGAPYHLKIDLMGGTSMCLADEERHRRALIAAIEELPSPENVMISTSMVEALQRLGALEDSEREHVDIVLQQIRECLADPESVDGRARAYGVYSSQFDHPYSGAYHETISGLSEPDRKTLLMMAARGAPDTMAFLLPILLELASFDDPGTGDCFSLWTDLPATNSFMPQEAIVVFAVAHVVLGRLGCPLPDEKGSDGYSAEALTACGAILYWLNRYDLDETTRRRSCEPYLQLLLQHDRGAALDVIRHCEHELRKWGLAEGLKGPAGAPSPKLSIVGAFPAETVEVSRHALGDPASQVGYFGSGPGYNDRQNLPFAMDVLACHGISEDRHLLRGYKDDDDLGTSAIAAVENLEERLLG